MTTAGGIIRLLDGHSRPSITPAHVALFARAGGSIGRLVLLAGLASLMSAPFAQASDASLSKALKRYEARLTSDISYLSSYSTPSKHRAAAVLSRQVKISLDLTGATNALSRQQASTSSGRKGRTDVLSALRDARLAASDARACAIAVRSGHESTARKDANAEQKEIHTAIPLFESGGRLLHLF